MFPFLASFRLMILVMLLPIKMLPDQWADAGCDKRQGMGRALLRWAFCGQHGDSAGVADMHVLPCRHWRPGGVEQIVFVTFKLDRVVSCSSEM